MVPYSQGNRPKEVKIDRDDFYDEQKIDDLRDEDEITIQEAAFMRGWLMADEDDEMDYEKKRLIVLSGSEAL